MFDYVNMGCIVIWVVFDDVFLLGRFVFGNKNLLYIIKFDMN